MAQETPTAVLGQELEARLAEFSRKRLRDKRKAFGLKIGAALLGAAVTVLLGLRVSADLEVTLTNIALVAGAVVAILHAWDAFYDHKALWVKRTTTVARLKKLRRAFLAARAASPELDPKDLEGFHMILDQILDDDLSSWVQMRSDASEKQPSTTGAGAATAHH